MVVRRRAVVAACASGLIALALMLMIRGVVSHQQASSAGLPSTMTPLLSAAATVPLSDEGRIVSMRERADAIVRAQVWRDPRMPVARANLGSDGAAPSTIDCQFRFNELGGTSQKFDCLLQSGKPLRIKYGPGAEIPAEAAASRLVNALGFGADTVTLVEHLRCYGCPHEPF